MCYVLVLSKAIENHRDKLSRNEMKGLNVDIKGEYILPKGCIFVGVETQLTGGKAYKTWA